MQQHTQLAIEMRRRCILAGRHGHLHQAPIRSLTQGVYGDHAAQVACRGGVVAFARYVCRQPLQRRQKPPLLVTAFEQRASIERHNCSQRVRLMSRQRCIKRRYIRHGVAQIQAQRMPGGRRNAPGLTTQRLT